MYTLNKFGFGFGPKNLKNTKTTFNAISFHYGSPPIIVVYSEELALARCRFVVLEF
jgi:hypothetical protein